MADYTKPPMNNLPFSFGTGGYSAPNFNDVNFKFKERAIVSTYSDVGATIVGVRDYLKECPTYVVGYGPYGVQIIKGRCIYGGIRDLGAYVNAVKAQGQADLGASLVVGANERDLPASIIGVVTRDLPAFISGHLPVDLGAAINILYPKDLGADLTPVPPKDLSAYIRVHPQSDLPANIYGWEQRDLGASIDSRQSRDLGALIGAHSPKDLTARLKGWVREATHDLSAYIKGFAYNGLGGIIRATYLTDMPAQIFAVVPKDLSANIYGWAAKDLTANIKGVKLPTDLSASITATGDYKNLSAIVKPMTATKVPADLGASVISWYGSYLGAYINPSTPRDLGAYLSPAGASENLSASIYPKMIRLSTYISFTTMMSSDMSATLNICMGSESRNLTAYIRSLEKLDLGAIIYGQSLLTGSSNLGASVGFTNKYYVVDKLPINVYVSYGEYWTEDKLPISLYVGYGSKNLGVYIKGILHTEDLGAQISGVNLAPYGFENPKSRQKVYYRSYLGEKLRFEVAELSFRSVVKEYFYVSGNNQAYKTNRLDRWVTDVKSYIPRNVRLNIKRRFHRMMAIHEITDFDSVDEAIRFAIEYVTDYPEIDLGAYINARPNVGNMGASVTPIYVKTGDINLTSTITGS